MRVLYAGTPQTAVAPLEALIDANFDIVGVLTRADAESGRGRRLTPSPVARRAQERGLPVLKLTTLRSPQSRELIEELRPDVVAVVAYGMIVPADLLDVPTHGWINLHYSLLPAYRGAAPVQHAILSGESLTGTTTFRIGEGLDTGPVYGVSTRAIPPTATAGEMLELLSADGADLLVATLRAVEAGTAVAVPQSEDGVTFAPRLTPADAEIDWTRPAFAVDRQIRAMTPEPGPWTTLGGQRFKIGPVLPVTGESESRALAPGKIDAQKRRVLVGTGSGVVQLGRVAPAGKGMMDAADWARGARLGAGAVFGEGASNV